MGLPSPTRGDDHRRGLFLTAIGAVLFTFDVPLIRLAASDKWTLMFARGLLLFLAMTVLWMVFQRGWRGSVSYISGVGGIIAAVSSTLANLMFLAAVTETTAANLVFIIALNPVICAFLAWMILKERVAWQTWLAILMALLGVAIIVWSGQSVGTTTGDLLALGVATCMAITLTAARWSGKNIMTSLAIGALASACIAAFWAEPATLPPVSWGWLAINALVIVPVAMALLAIGPRYLPAPEVAMFFLLELILTPLWMWFIFGESPTREAFIGGTIIFLTLLCHSVWRLATGGRTRPLRTETATP
ncbi:DMT family transporter [Nordella sp. HKS 07]|uniref:DMT family transporter n=1 Tax=Nordella sp. HKS 07 TaxID=2712222 RepID=UPI0013E16BB1|nr:DMT family transporter [Nordella sp. HKS 07]QIG50874.1 DMT family transporter [Nordella sp. HKS 07]